MAAVSSKRSSWSALQPVSLCSCCLADRLREPLHLLEYVLDPEEATLASQELHGLEEPRAHGASRGGEAEGVYKVPGTLLLLGGEAAHGLLDGLLRPLWQGREPRKKLR